MVHKKALGDDALHDQVERVDCDQPSAHVGVSNKGPMRAERADDYCTALARNSVDGELHPSVANCCLDLIEHPVFVHDHQIATNCLQLLDEFRAAHEIDGLQTPRLGDGDERPSDA
jgi:hypothetical protein